MRAITLSVSIVLLLWMLSIAPFVHSHSRTGHDGDAVVHGHLPEQHAGPASDGPELGPGDHAGRRVDLFTSIPGRADPYIVDLEHRPESAPELDVRFHGWSRRSERERGPPTAAVGSRAPPA